jgi:hypothetical protein
MLQGAGHHLPVRADLQGQVRGERVHGHGDAAAGHPLVPARLRGPAQRVRRHQPRHPTRRLRQAFAKSVVLKVMLRIHDILVRIRIRIRILLFSSLTLKTSTKNKFKKSFSAFYVLKLHLHHFFLR